MYHPYSLRLSRLRRTTAIRTILQETTLHPSQFIAPLFIHATHQKAQAIQSMPGQFQLDFKSLIAEVDELQHLGIQGVILFGIPETKDSIGSSSLDSKSVVQKAIKIIRKHFPALLIIADVCLCEYTDHGHCGALIGQEIDREKTLSLLAAQAVSFAEAGADWVAPSSMTDNMVYAIRDALDEAKFTSVAILSYSIKYASSFYGPFREAAGGTPQFGDRKAYQMNPANGKEAYREAALDLEEGADILMVKPAMNYLDVIYRIKEKYPEVPLCAYQVSGEYALIKQGALAGLIDENKAMEESLLSIKRAGADFIITYFAKEMAKLLKRKNLNER